MLRARRRALALLAAGALACAAAAPLPARAAEGAPARSAPTKQERARAAELKKQGDDAMVTLRYADALAAYEGSYAIVPDPALLYNKGRALQALARFPEALEQLEAFAAQASPKLKARVPALAELIAEVRSKVSTLALTCNVAGARVLLNSKVIGVTPLSGPIKVNAGAATMEVEAEGHFPFRKKVELPGNGELAVEARLTSRSTTGILVVRSPVAGARVSVDGRPVGAAPAEASLRAGTHTLVVERDGYEAARTTAVVVAGERKQVTIPLERTKPLVARWYFWAGVGAVVVGGAVLTGALITERSPGSGDIPPGQVSAPLLRY